MASDEFGYAEEQVLLQLVACPSSLVPQNLFCQAKMQKRKKKLVLNIYDPGGVLMHRAEFLHKAGEIQSSVKCAW